MKSPIFFATILALSFGGCRSEQGYEVGVSPQHVTTWPDTAQVARAVVKQKTLSVAPSQTYTLECGDIFATRFLHEEFNARSSGGHGWILAAIMAKKPELNAVSGRYREGIGNCVFGKAERSTLPAMVRTQHMVPLPHPIPPGFIPTDSETEAPIQSESDDAVTPG